MWGWFHLPGRVSVRFSQASLALALRSLKLAEAEVTVVEAATSAERSYTTAFWPEHGAVAAVAGGFMVQARIGSRGHTR